MFPIVLTERYARILIIGDGPLAEKRHAQLSEAKMNVRRITGGAVSDDDLKSAHAVFIVDTPPETAKALADRCRALSILVNVEDVMELCDFHTPSIVRRGDLLFSVSTGGKSPALARRLRKFLENRFSPEWAEKLDKLGAMRDAWRSQGLKMDEVSARTEAIIDEEGWLS